MRVSEDRYTKDLRRLNLARRLIRHEVRTQWICAWTGLSDDRVRNLFRSYQGSTGKVIRHRGPSPARLQTFLRSPALRAEASAIGGLAVTLGAVPDNAKKNLPGIETAERVCEVFELYRHVAPQSRFSMDQFFLLLTALSEGQDLQISHCRNCHGALLVDPLGDARRVCVACRQDALSEVPEARGGGSSQGHEDPPTSDRSEGDPAEGSQQSLF